MGAPVNNNVNNVARPAMSEVQNRIRMFWKQLNLKRNLGEQNDAYLRRWATIRNISEEAYQAKREEMVSLYGYRHGHRQSVVDFLSRERTLEEMNAMLVELDLEPQPSKTKAHKELRKVFINIYDLVAGNYAMRFSSRAALRLYSQENDMVFPKATAKGKLAQEFLRHLFG